MTTTSVRLPVPLRETAESYGRSVDRSLAWLLREALVEYLERHMDAPAEAPPGPWGDPLDRFRSASSVTTGTGPAAINVGSLDALMVVAQTSQEPPFTAMPPEAFHPGMPEQHWADHPNPGQPFEIHHDEIVSPAQVEGEMAAGPPDKVVGLMAALETSVNQAKAAAAAKRAEASQGSADPAPDPAPASDEAVDCPGRRGHTPEQGAGPFPSCKHCGAFRVNGVWKRP